MKKIFCLSLGILLCNFLLHGAGSYDLSMVGHVRFADGFGRQSIGTIDCLKDLVSINYLGDSLGTIDPRNMSGLENVDPVVSKIIFNKDRTPGNVIIYEPLLSAGDAYKRLSEKSIRIAYSMTSCSRIQSRWASVLNNYFDAVAVPSEFLVDAYKKSGVKKPVFHLPLGVYLDNFFDYSVIKKGNASKRLFVFGSTESFHVRKNQGLLIKAFVEEFGGNPNVVLRLNSRKCGEGSAFKQLKNLVEKIQAKNIEITERTLSWQEYTHFMGSLDCCVNISQGEGYSIIPREAMALGIPCILSDNAAQSELCKMNFVRSVPANQEVAAQTEWYTGYLYNCDIVDLKKALRDMYDNYATWSERAQKNRAWVKQFTWQDLQKKYLNLVKPTKIVLGTKNEITDDCLETNSPILYKKYCAILKT